MSELYCEVNPIMIEKKNISFCPACANKFLGKYCFSCAEKKMSGKDLTIPHFIEETFEGVTHFDNKFFRTIKNLLFHPGLLTRNFSPSLVSSLFPSLVPSIPGHAAVRSLTHGVIQFYECAIISALLISIIELSLANNKILSIFRLNMFRRSTFRMFPVFTRISFFGRPCNNNDSRKSLYLLITTRSSFLSNFYY